MSLDPFGSGPWPVRKIRRLLSSIHTSGVRSHDEQCSQKRISNLVHAYMFCATMESTGHTVKVGRSRFAHKLPTRNISEQL